MTGRVPVVCQRKVPQGAFVGPRRKHWRTLASVLAVAMLALVGCNPQLRQRKPVIIAYARTSEQMILGKLTANLLESEGYRVEEKASFASEEMVRKALEAGTVDVAWAYTGDAWTSYLGHDIPISDPQELLARVRDEDERNGIVWLSPAPYQRALGVWVLGPLADTSSVRTISDLAAQIRSVDPNLELCVQEHDYVVTNGVLGLEMVYGFEVAQSNLRLFDSPESLGAAATGTCDCAVAPVGDAWLMSAGGRPLIDNRGFFLASSLAPVVRESALQDFPDLELYLGQLSVLLTRDAVVDMYMRVAVDSEKPNRAARRLLMDHGLLDTVLQP